MPRRPQHDLPDIGSNRLVGETDVAAARGHHAGFCEGIAPTEDRRIRDETRVRHASRGAGWDPVNVPLADE